MGYDKNYHPFTVTWERGLLEVVEDSMLPPGAAARLRNWVADPSGNLRVRPPWQKGSTTGAPATRVGLGIGYFAMQRRPYIRQFKTGTTAAGSEPLDVSATWDASTLTGSLLVARLYASTQTAGPVGNFTVTAPAGWSLAIAPAAGSRTSHCWIYYKANAAAESSIKTFNVAQTGTTTVALALRLDEVLNCATSPLDQTATLDSGSTSNPASGTTAATTVPVGIAMAAFAGAAVADRTFSAPSNGYTLGTEFYVNNGSADLNAVGAYKVYSSIGTQSTDVTLDSGITDGVGSIATFKGTDYGATDGVMFTANDESPNIKVYYVDRSNLSAGTHTLVDTIAASSATSPVAFTSGNEHAFWTHVSFTAVREWGGFGTTAAAISGSPPGRCIAWHKNRLFVGGTLAEPWKLHFSEFGDHTTWDAGSATYLDVGKGDGEAIEDITPFQDGLMVVKQTRVYYLTGSSPSSFRLIPLPVGGAAPGRSVLSTQYGAVIAGRKNVWVFNGSEIALMSQPIRDSYGLTDDWMSMSYLDEKVSICDQGSGTVWTFDFTTNTWSEEMVGSASTEGPAVIYNQDNTQFFTPKNATVGSVLNYRNIPGTTLGKDFDTLSETFEAWTPETWILGPGEKFTARYLFLKLRQRGGTTGQTGLTVTPYYDGSAGTAQTVAAHAAAGVYWHRLSLGDVKGVSEIQLRFTQTLPSTEASCFDIEEVVIGFNQALVA